MNRTLLVGLDAACWEYLHPLLEAGRLPVIQNLISQGAVGTLRSTLPAWTPTAWATIVTGKNPGKHGVYGMMYRKPGTYDFIPTNSSVRQGTPFWRRLNAQGISVGLVNVPFTHPPDEIDGFVVCGFGAPNGVNDLISPQAARAAVKQSMGYSRPALKAKQIKKMTPEQILREESELQEGQVDIAVMLAQKMDVQVLVINLMLLDHANHYLSSMAQVQEAICHSDAHLGKLIDGFKPDNVMLISDHGSRRLKGDFLLFEWLLDRDYVALVPRTDSEAKQAQRWLLESWLESRIKIPAARMLVRQLLAGLLTYFPEVMSERIWRRIERDYPSARRYVKYAPKIDYRRSKVVPEAQYAGLIYLNQMGREPSGVISEADRKEFATDLCSKLKELLDPDTGERLLAGVYSPEDLYKGQQTPYAPDIILDGFSSPWGIRCSYQELSGMPREDYFMADHGDLGQHSRNGICVFSGKEFKAEVEVGSLDLTSVAPTLLSLYDVPIPEDYDGVTVDHALVEKKATTYQTGDLHDGQVELKVYSNAEESELLSRLQALGYLE